MILATLLSCNHILMFGIEQIIALFSRADRILTLLKEMTTMAPDVGA